MKRVRTQNRAALRRAEKLARNARKSSVRHPGSTALRSLSTAALALPGVAGNALADAAADSFAADVNYSYYKEDNIKPENAAPGSERSRYEIHILQFHLDAPVTDRIDLDVNVAWESMSGASPWRVEPDPLDGRPVQVMTGATIEDARTDLEMTGNYYFDSARASASTGFSVEKDYLAFNFGGGWDQSFNDNNTTLSTGFGMSFDKIEATDADLYPGRPKKEHKQSYSVFAGLSQTLSRSAIVQASATYQHSTGYLSDPYKQVTIAGTPVHNSRPDQRNQGALLARYRQHFGSLNGTLHGDYRFAFGDWEVTSHTFEIAWFQALGDALRVIPSFRYYSQSQAKFYAPYFLSEPGDGYFASDYRLSPFGALSYGLKAETTWPSFGGKVDWRSALSYRRYASDASWALGDVAVENPGLVAYHLFSFALTARF